MFFLEYTVSYELHKSRQFKANLMDRCGSFFVDTLIGL